MTWQQTWQDAMVPNYGTPELALHAARGDQVMTTDGDVMVDLLGGVAVNVVGHRHPQVEAAVQEQVDLMWHASNLYAHAPGLGLANRLRELSGKKCLFVNSGTEANEAAIKLIRRRAHVTGRDGVILAFDGSFHGRTMGALGATGQAHHREGFGDVEHGFVHVPWNDAAAIENAFTRHNIIGAIFEPIQGEGGIRPMSVEAAQALQDCATAHDAVLVCDEVQTGMGRTGSLWAHDALPIDPDIITLAKGLGGGWPIGACLVSDELADILGPGTHGCTFGGHPVSCAAAYATLDVVVEDALDERAERLGQLIQDIAQEEGVTVRGRGLMQGFPMSSQAAAKAQQAMQVAGYLVGVAGPDVVRITPPLTINEERLASGVRTLCGAIHALEMPVPAA